MNKNHNANDQSNTPIKFKQARIIHLSWSVVVFRNVVFVFGNQTMTFFFILLAVYEIKIILQVLRTFSMLLFLSWMYILNMAKRILHRPTLKPYKFNCLKSNWFEIMFHWFRLFPFCLRLYNKMQSIFHFVVFIIYLFFTISSQFWFFYLTNSILDICLYLERYAFQILLGSGTASRFSRQTSAW